MTRFRVRDTFVLSSRSLFVVAGDIDAGIVGVGQTIRSPILIDEPAHAVESVLHSASTGESSVGLCFRYPDDATLTRWREVLRKGMLLELSEPAR